eukprot:GHVT01097165.1.p1 GENE.GHVT01097165.1~~GHVT01097165.1.p1  ORF type:complete len:366 (-),score=49.55 GHVT01097165.1:478-1575(-)
MVATMDESATSLEKGNAAPSHSSASSCLASGSSPSCPSNCCLTCTVPSLVVIVGASRGYGRGIACSAANHLRGPLFLLLLGRDVAGMEETGKLAIEIRKKTKNGMRLLVKTNKLDLAAVEDKVSSAVGSALLCEEIIQFCEQNSSTNVYLMLNAATLKPVKFLSHQNPSEIAETTRENVTSFAVVTASFIQSWTALLRRLSESSLEGEQTNPTSTEEPKQHSTIPPHDDARGTRPNAPHTLGLLRIVQISSLAALQAIPSWSSYCSQKAYRDMFMQCLALDLAAQPETEGKDAKALSWAPGLMKTQMVTVDAEASESEAVRGLAASPEESFMPIELSAGRLWSLLLSNCFVSGSHVDVHDEEAVE